MESTEKTHPFDTPAIYRIRVRGSLNEVWSSRLGGMQIIRDEAKNKPVTILYGYFADQAAPVWSVK